jgi:hypothetical protein
MHTIAWHPANAPISESHITAAVTASDQLDIFFSCSLPPFLLFTSTFVSVRNQLSSVFSPDHQQSTRHRSI